MDLVTFLIEARRATYAIPDGESSGDGGEQLTYQDGAWAYRDRYFGKNPYGGQELIWKGEQTVWIMNYYAQMTSERVPIAEIYDFQMEVMRNPIAENPMRGPSGYKRGDFEYRNETQGSIERFTGRESILYQGEEIYWMIYHGGLVDA
jgi:hypothetical protein